MAASLEKLLEEATRPEAEAANWDVIKAFCDKILEEDDGPRDACFMLLDKIRSPRLNVALRALDVLEACVQQCGPPMHSIVGRFKFLNECIKMVSPKYHENRPEPVVQRVLSLIQTWARNLPNEPKVKEVYNMLKRQGMAFADSESSPNEHVAVGEGYLGVSQTASERPSPLEHDERQSKMLQRLLQSKDPNDLRKANKLIQKMVRKDQERTERAVTLRGQIDGIQENTKTGLIAFSRVSQKSQNALISILVFSNCTLGALRPAPSCLLDLDFSPTPASAPTNASNGLFDAFGSSAVASPPGSTAAPADPFDLLSGFGGSSAAPAPTPAAPAVASEPQDPFAAFGQLGVDSKPSNAAAVAPAPVAAPASVTNPLDDLLGSSFGANTPAAAAPPAPLDMSQISIDMSSIRSNPSLSPVTLYDKNSVKVMLHFAADSPHPDALVCVVSVLNFNGAPIENILFQAAVPRALQVKLMPASASSVEGHNPMAGAKPVTQVMVIGNPDKKPIKLRFKFSFTLNGQTVDDMGDCAEFPPM
ncbi:uncharacterized protein MONBRDRAFT_34260 [Monosiga brevicollis MX1]|uniref:VHS domain-containing protein n=1 Tax=Monosiga brevicollis TaxID=81824 RepID=A9VAJ4_MONBE|nr:uncharacterized protein MONBRDRAFT_34260 [Monosiga brevicollis MX1]EDQ85495.1 predicted protein [Monosiga brevicollis MX1]|eukprot:XP_001749686.1 hypothetical protein [Monosiga brevicollis MX1]